MEIFRIVEPVTTIINKKGEEVEGVYKIIAAPITNRTNTLRATLTYESVATLDAGQKIIPDVDTLFLGEVVQGTLYILKFIDQVPSAYAEETEFVPKYKRVGVPKKPGEFFFRSPAFNFISILRNGVIKVVSSMGAFFYFDPYIPGRGVLELLDRFYLTAKNFVFNLFGGKMSWTNFNEDDVWKSELALDIYRGQSTDRNKDNLISVQAGSLTKDKASIYSIGIKHKTDDNIFETLNKFGDYGLYNSLAIDKVQRVEEVKLESIESGISTESVQIRSKILGESIEYDIDVKGHQVTLNISADSIDITSSKVLNISSTAEINVDTAKAIIDSPDVTITGGILKVKGSAVPPSTSGPWNSLPVCPFTGAPHAAVKVVGT